MKLGSKHFWLRSPMGLVVIILLAIIPTLLLALLIGNTSNLTAVAFGVAIAAVRHAAWKRWGDD